MGNRAVIATEKKDVGIYLHWNGGRDTVEPLLAYCKMRGFRRPEDDNYGWARLCQVMANFLGGDISIGIGPYAELDKDNFDNGVYIIKNWEIVGREFFEGAEQDSYDSIEMLLAFDQKQPNEDRLGGEKITELYANLKGEQK